MAHIHLQYLQEQGQDSSTMELILSDFLTVVKDPALGISVRYSLPLFFVKLLIDQYGLDLTEQMAKTFNAPGPITIRRNAIRCRSNSELQSLLSNRHGIRSAPIVPAQWNYHRNGTDPTGKTFDTALIYYLSVSTALMDSLWHDGRELNDQKSKWFLMTSNANWIGPQIGVVHNITETLVFEQHELSLVFGY
ncbi:unnamed protein product [Cylindrotheca closterium]|nr:unnamed protein product [Cylindrotheca closterium]